VDIHGMYSADGVRTTDDDPTSEPEGEATLAERAHHWSPAISRAIVSAFADLDAAVEWFVYKRATNSAPRDVMSLEDVRTVM